MNRYLGVQTIDEGSWAIIISNYGYLSACWRAQGAGFPNNTDAPASEFHPILLVQESRLYIVD